MPAIEIDIEDPYSGRLEPDCQHGEMVSFLAASSMHAVFRCNLCLKTWQVPVETILTSPGNGMLTMRYVVSPPVA